MKIADVKAVVGSTPHMSLSQARQITEHLFQYEPNQLLELGFKHGVSTCYMAAALDEMKQGHITTIDLESARHAEPNVEQLLERLGLRDRVTVYYEPTSYTWRMMKMLDSERPPAFDFCYLDGAHSWFVDGFAFFLVDRLLEEGGWIIFDDMNWRYIDSPTLKTKAMVTSMPEEERQTRQVRKVFELLVKKHPNYGEFREENGWGFARKIAANSDRTIAVEYIRERYGLGEFLARAFRRIMK